MRFDHRVIGDSNLRGLVQNGQSVPGDKDSALTSASFAFR